MYYFGLFHGQSMATDLSYRRCNFIKLLMSALSFLSQLSICVSSPVFSAHPLHGNKYYDGKALSVPINTDSGIHLYQHWMEQAYSGLFSAFAQQKAASLPKYARKELADCFSKATTVILHANCLLTLLPEKSGEVQYTDHSEAKINGTNTPETNNASKPNVSITHRLSKYQEKANSAGWLGGFRLPAKLNSSGTRREFIRAKRSAAITHRQNYELLGKNNGMGPLGAVAKLLNAVLLSSKNRTKTIEWQQTIDRVRLFMAKKKEKETEKERHSSESNEQTIFRGQGTKELARLDEIIHKPKMLKQMVSEKRKQGALDATSKLTNLVRQGLKLGFTLAGENTTDFDEKTLKLVSPRFLSLTPEENDTQTVSLLSPSLFSMHNEGKGLEKMISLPNLIKEFNGKDQQAWMTFVLEAAGINEQVDKMEKEDGEEERLGNVREKYKEEVKGVDGQPLYFTKENVTERFGEYEKKKIETWEKLTNSYSKEQLKELNKTGYSIMSKEQIKMVYGNESPYNHSETYSRLKSLSLSRNHMEKHIEADVKRTAELESFQLKRQRDITLSPVVLSPIVLAAPLLSQSVILSPLVLSPIVLTPSVLGPIILSPWVFIPVILSPRVLGPLIVNPLLLSPVVLSPLVLHPFILTPGVFIPFILTPFVLSPLILSPQVFSPLVLSPLVLNPLILTPMVGSPLVLSPFVLSPLILSPQALFALVLSPYALSPLIESKLIASALILSPSWLS